ncbi:ornithine carbamoyltransferase [Seinonella peptonophila]|uniref:Ornithine carbamoyltransferase n=1 Tax=Seinonella peptonophila TaxID=112248 RepID=A0A1M4XQK4_9BACL|nr:ornithine carbamoyltransferase [Seinonella peptonophila]SHE95711.1 ornithine carbamoyltransferase [Seinonella peptonophila]
MMQSLKLANEEILLSLKNKDCLTLFDYTPKQIEALVLKAYELKQQKKEQGSLQSTLSNKGLALIFDKASTRTRISFETGMNWLGGFAMTFNQQDLQLGRGESIGDTGATISRYVDGIMIRISNHQLVEQLAAAAEVPVINGLTDLYHPCQTLADLLTIYEHKGNWQGLKMAYVGDGNNVLHSLMHGAAAVGMDLSIATPSGYEPLASVVDEAKEWAKHTGAVLHLCHDPIEAVQDADVIYTDVWASMGQEQEKEARIKAFAGFQVDVAMMNQAKQDAIFMHCLPAYRGIEVTEEVIDGSSSVVFDQAENRLHAQNGLLVTLLA